MTKRRMSNWSACVVGSFLYCVAVPWAPGNQPAGFVRRALNMQHLVVSNAGHMVRVNGEVVMREYMCVLSYTVSLTDEKVVTAPVCVIGSSLQARRGARHDPNVRDR